MRYIIQVEETLGTEFELEAEDRDHALALAMERYYACEVVLSSENFTGVAFNVKENE